MATSNAIADVIDMFIDAPLQFIPRDTGRTGELWLEVFKDIPDEVFIRAGKDYLKSETEWPAPAKLRTLAVEVKRHNGNSVRHDDFSAAKNQITRLYSWAARVGKDHWYTVAVDVSTVQPKQYTPLELLMMRDCETWTEEERAWFERETGEEAPCK